jgi:hypothetical protein
MLRFLGIFLLSLPLIAQTFTGSIGGRITDAAGLPVPNVQVSVTEKDTNDSFRTVSSGSGDYLVSFLKPGVYRVAFTVSGFKEETRVDLPLQLNQSFRLDQTMQVGSVNENIEVAAAATQVNYDSPEIAHVVGSEQLENIPEITNPTRGRSPLLLARLVPGVTSTSPNNSNINNFSFGGGRPVTNEILEDGLPTTNPSDNTYTFTPSPDSVDEFKVITTPFSAEFGHTGGGVLLVTSKHGGNEYHGTVYDYFRNRILNARNFFQAQNDSRFVQNNPGGTFSGPVILPHYDGRNKTFFFIDFNETLVAQPAYALTRTPTDLERSGNFSQSDNGAPVLIYDPKTTVVGAQGNITRTLFAGGVIPASRIDPVAARIVSFYPQSNGNFGSGNNYNVSPTEYDNTLQGLIRFDHNFSDNDKMFIRYGRYNPSTQAISYIPNAANYNNANGWWDNQVALSETHIFSPTLVLESRLGFIQEINYENAAGPAVPQLGLQGVPLTAFPYIKTNNFIRLGGDGANHDRDRSWVLNEALQTQKGSHTLKIGGDYRRQMYNNYSPGLLSGIYNFDQTFTSISSNPNSGFDLADLLLGYPNDTQIQNEDYTYRLNINSAALYLQDDYKVNSKFTLNLGLRWEFDGPYSEANNQFASFNPNIINTQTGTPGSVQFAGRNGAPSHFMPNVYHDFLPRVGYAWNFMKDTVFRGGVAFYRLPNIGYSSIGPLSQYQKTADFQSLDGGATPRYELGNGVPPVPYNVDASGNPLVPASLTNPTSTAYQIDSRTRTPYSISWQFGVQRQFGSWFAEVDYAANKGVKLPILLQTDQLQPNQFAASSQALRPFPQYAGVDSLTLDGNSIYHSLQAKLEHRWKNGLVISAAYTFSKLIDDVDASARANHVGVQNVYDLQAERGVGGYDIPQRFVANYVYSIPLGRGGKFLTETPILRDVISGWQFAGITEFQSGQPLAVSQNNNTHGYTETQRPNAIGNPVPSNGQTLTQWINTAAFQLAPAYTLGDSPRFPLHGPGLNNTDFALQRNFPFNDRVRLQLRGEFFNAFNHAQFTNPKANLSSPSSFGVITGAQSGRITELVLRLFF